MLSAQCNYKNDSVSVVLHSTLVMFPFLGKSVKKENKNFPERAIFPLGVSTGSCLQPQVSQMIPAARPSRWSPPACRPPAACQWSRAQSRSPPPEPKSWEPEHRSPSHREISKPLLKVSKHKLSDTEGIWGGICDLD